MNLRARLASRFFLHGMNFMNFTSRLVLFGRVFP
jgi:hypothetical protein